MSNPTDSDMDQPITKHEFHDVLKSLFGYLDGRFRTIDDRFEAIERRFDKRFDEFEARLKSWLEKDFRGEIFQAIGHATGMNSDQLRRDVVQVEDKYKDLPGRVTKLEAKVFAPKRQRRR